MAQWNGNGYCGPWQGPGPGPSYPPPGQDSSRQYVGFNDFLHQFQHTVPAAFPPPVHYPPPHYQQPYIPPDYQTGNNYNKENSSNSGYLPESSNKRWNNNKKPLEPTEASTLDNSSGEGVGVASRSKLTATAIEFVPLSARPPFPTSTDPEPSSSTVTPRPTTSKPAPEYNNKREGYSNKWKSRNEGISNTNWRSREPDAEPSGPPTPRNKRVNNPVRSNNYKEKNEQNSVDTRVFSNTASDKENERGHTGRGSYHVTESFGRQVLQEDGEARGRRGGPRERDRNNKTKNNITKGTNVRDQPPPEHKEVGQRERLSEQLDRGELECLVCCERVRQPDAVWACGNCYHVLHLKCVQRWANASLQEGEWRCPACQHKVRDVPSEYRCFCGARLRPEWVRGSAAHGCGEPCGAHRSCSLHACALPCHPGPCPPCQATARRACECGATTQLRSCSLKTPLLCGAECGRPLTCRAHRCAALCHAGPCEPCQQTVDQKCYCPLQTERTIPCERDSAGVEGYSCGGVCSRLRSCGNHPCGEPCHPGPCASCPLSPGAVTHCPCGQTPLAVPRTSCLEPVPVCDKLCSRPLTCGPPEAPHVCSVNCHHGDCPTCPDSTIISCRCGHLQQGLKCSTLDTERDNLRCGRKCTKKQSCGRHRCKEKCCVDPEHRCLLPCTRTLSCGLHRCEDTCHRGHCQPCWRISFEEMSCRCGAAVRYPPVECGARPPSCTQPCPEPRACGHEPLHSCHPAPSPCPPCVVLTQRYCHGKHKSRKTIPCHQEDFSCGLACGKELSCGSHRCVETCHRGPCPEACSQRCEAPRPGCGHACAAACGHAAPCPSTGACKAVVPAACPCGRRSQQRQCHEQRAALRRLTVLPGPLGEPVDISALLSQGNTSVTLECDLECQVEDRNRRLAIGLQIRNPDLSSKLAPKYSDSLKQMATREEPFAQRVHEQLTQLVTLSRESKQRTRSHSFAPMSRQRRQFVHELCQHFGCDSAAYDAEPYRNIVATAYKDKSWLPALSLLEAVRREKGQRRVPGPQVLPAARSGSAWATLRSAPAPAPAAPTPPAPPARPRIDYFDNPPED